MKRRKPSLYHHRHRVVNLTTLISIAGAVFPLLRAAAGFQVWRRPFGAPRHLSRPFHNSNWKSLHLSASKQEQDAASPEERDWRAFRARLVQQDLQSSSAPSLDDGTASDITRWAYDAGMNIEVGTVLLSIPTTDLCQALEQQYFHRCVVLVTHRNEQGIRGILLNRPTAFMYKAADDDYEWCLWFGGDMYEDNIDDDAEILCLHSLTSPDAKAVSEPLQRGLFHTTLVQARALVKEGTAKPSDFWCFGGHCKWYPGQLEQEMGPERGEWYAVSLDATSILNEIRQQAQAGPSSAGVDMWEVLIDRIEKQKEAVSHIPSGQLRFYDRMLQAWVNTNLVLTSDESVAAANNPMSRAHFEPGTLLRATMKAKGFACPPFLLSEQDFHRSLVLVLSDSADSTVGVHLNLPLSGIVEVSEKIRLTIRYGGPTDLGDSNDDGSFVWIHRSPSLQKAGAGKPLGTSGFWTIKEDDAVDALQSGDALPDEVMVFSGVCVWEKDDDMGVVGGGLREQVEATESMQIVSAKKAGTIWKMLSRQEVLTNETLESNLDVAIAAWEAATDADDFVDINAVGGDDMQLADAALRAWVAVSLLDEPTTTLVEVPEG